MKKQFRILTGIFVFALVFMATLSIALAISPIIVSADGETDGVFVGYSENISDLENITKNTESTDNSPIMTILVHGLGANAATWSSDGIKFGYSEESLIEMLAGDRLNTVTYHATMEKSEELSFKLCLMNNGDYSNTTSKSKLSLDDVSKHLIIVFDGKENYSTQGSEFAYNELNFVIDKLLYDVKHLGVNNPRINLIGHSRGGLLNMMYAIDHPYNVAGLFSIGTPYTGTTMYDLGEAIAHISELPELIRDYLSSSINSVGAKDIVDTELIENYKSQWNNLIHNSNINAHAIGSAMNVDYIDSALLDCIGLVGLVQKINDFETVEQFKTLYEQYKAYFEMFLGENTQFIGVFSLIDEINHCSSVYEVIQLLCGEIKDANNFYAQLLGLNDETIATLRKADQDLGNLSILYGIYSAIYKDKCDEILYNKYIKDTALSDFSIDEIINPNGQNKRIDIKKLMNTFGIDTEALALPLGLVFDDLFGSNGINIIKLKSIIQEQISSDFEDVSFSKVIESIKLVDYIVFWGFKALQYVSPITLKFDQLVSVTVDLLNKVLPFFVIVDASLAMKLHGYASILAEPLKAVLSDIVRKSDSDFKENWYDALLFWDNEYVFLNDGLVDLDSQMANGFDGFKRYAKLYDRTNADMFSLAMPNMPIPIAHNLEPKDKDIINYIVQNIDLGVASNSNFIYKSNNDSTLTILGTKSTYDVQGALTIPDQLNGKTVAAIADGAFNSAKFNSVTVLTLPSTLKKIGNNAFRGFTSLSDIDLPNNLQSIGDFAFSNTKIKTVTIPDTVTYIGRCAFNRMEQLESINVIQENEHFCSAEGVLYNKAVTELICYPHAKNSTVYATPDSLISVGVEAFSSNKNIRSLSLNNVKSIADNAFADCANISSVSAPKLEMLGAVGFNDTAWIDSQSQEIVTLGKILVKFNGNDIKIPTDFEGIGPNAFEGSNIATIDLSGIYYFGENCFKNCKNLERIVLSSSVRSIGRYAFEGCDNLSIVFFPCNIPPQVDFGSLYCINDHVKIYVPQCAISRYQYVLSSDIDVMAMDTNVGFVGNTNIQYDDVNIAYGTIINNLFIPKKDGYRFDGWFDNADYNGTNYSNGSYWDKVENTTLYAKWSAVQYAIVFNDNNTENIDVKFVSNNEKLGELPIPVKTGYTFIGWYDSKGKAYTEDTVLQTAEHLNLSARWEVNNYAINFNANGGNVEPGSKNVKYGDCVGDLPTPSRIGYDFLGWNTQQNGQGESVAPEFIYNFDTDMTIYAQWKVHTYSISYFLDGGTIAAGNPTKYNIETSHIDFINPIKVGYTFVGWYHGNTLINAIQKGMYGDLELVAKWQENHYKITINAGEGSYDGPNPIDVTFNASFQIKPATRVGYVFEGWFDKDNNRYTTEDGQGIKLWDVASDMVLFAKWAVKTYKIQIRTDGSIVWLGPQGTLSDTPCDIEYGSVINALNFIATFKASSYGFKEGKIFDHFEYDGSNINWNTIPDLGDSGKVITIIPKWVLEKHTIYFNSLCEIVVEKVAQYYGTGIKLPTISRRGYSFKGWYTDAVAGNLVRWQTMPDLTPSDQNNGSIELFAHWELVEYPLQYILNGGSNHSNNPAHYNMTDEIILENASRMGYTFGGWYTDADFSQIITKIKDSVGTITLYAKWIANTYEIKYDPNGGAGEMINSNHTYDVAKDLSNNLYYKTGYTFIGWATMPSGDVVYSNTANVVNLATSGVFSLYAVWSPNTYVVIYDSNGGNGSMEHSVFTYDVSSPLRACTFERIGYSFKGWALSDNGTVVYRDKISAKNLATSGNVVLYAKWEIITYQISYVLNGGTNSVNNPVTYTIESSAIVFDNPSKMGFNFVDWTDESGLPIQNIQKGSTGNRVITANWYGYKISYSSSGTFDISQATYSGCTTAIVDCSERGALKITTFVIKSDVNEITFIGNTKKQLLFTQILIEDRTAPILIRFVNFCMSGPANENAIHFYEHDKITIENVGTSYIRGGNRVDITDAEKINWCVGIYGGTLNIEGTGELTIAGGNGFLWGEDGGYGVCGAIESKITKLIIRGGDGAPGKSGASSTAVGSTGGQASAGGTGGNGEDGGNGGNGRPAIIGFLKVHSGSTVILYGGNGGKGGDGGDGADGGKGGDGKDGKFGVKSQPGGNGGTGGQGGNGGNGGYGCEPTIMSSNIKIYEGGHLEMYGGDGGAGGNGGRGGNGGAGGAGAKTMFGNPVSGGNGGQGGQGGQGGSGGNGGPSTKVHESQPGQRGAGGNRGETGQTGSHG